MLDQSLAETGVLDFKFKFVPVTACRTRIDYDLHAFRAVLGRWPVANSAFCDRPAAQNFNVGINTCCCCRAKIHSFSRVTLHLTCQKITSDAAIIRPPRLSSPTTLSSSVGGVLSTDSFRQSRLDVGAIRNRVIKIAEQLLLLNPTPMPALGFKSCSGASPSESKLGGSWKLRFTTAADASFPTTEKRGVVSTSQLMRER